LAIARYATVRSEIDHSSAMQYSFTGNESNCSPDWLDSTAVSVKVYTADEIGYNLHVMVDVGFWSAGA
jgi:hypothetical protein